MKERFYYAFKNSEQAKDVINELLEKGYQKEELSLYAEVPEQFSVPNFSINSRLSSLADIGTGMIVVAALAGVFEWFMETHVFHLMPFGPATIYPFWGMLIGMAAGMFLGALIGGYVYMGRPDYQGKNELKDGKLLLVVKPKQKEYASLEEVGKLFQVKNLCL